MGQDPKTDTPVAVPRGVVGIFIDPEGRVIASASDFDPSGYGGFSRQEAQSVRVLKRLAAAVVDAYCSPSIVKVLGEYDCEKIVRNMVTDHGYTQTLVPIGYDVDNES